jgi:hypothetical protein
VNRFAAALGVALALLAAGCGSSSSPLPGWDVVAKGKASSGGASISATGSAKQPAAFAIRVEAKPEVTTRLTYKLDCGGQILSDDSKVSTPITTTMLVPPGDPASCTMNASVRKPASGKVTLTVFARSTPPTA